jgi:hypothetical protein
MTPDQTQNQWRELVLKHTKGGACNFQAAADELADLVRAAERERCVIAVKAQMRDDGIQDSAPLMNALAMINKA